MTGDGGLLPRFMQLIKGDVRGFYSSSWANLFAPCTALKSCLELS